MSDAEVLRARARQLARPVVLQAESRPDDVEALVVRVGNERLGILVSAIAAVSHARDVTPLPRAVAPVFGVTAWRGRPLTVYTLGSVIRETDQIVDARFVVLGNARRADLALLVDGIDDVITVPRSHLHSAAQTRRAEQAVGITDEGIIVIDPMALSRSLRRATRTTADPTRTE